ncbi:MarC family protein [Lewinella sp. 4G2]|uniref:MarC family protein n=1 Tax=Lewinella sp. 4G2 TaxID=1803372 RepID=UPI0007E05398|nr:MarC family protein [Lewinella sp. 4G2]OAV45001.1 antibiotic resistance protein MarC [Lewinella sp. 4G2]
MVTFFFATLGSLFSVVNPFGAIPIYLTLTSEMTPADRSNTALKTSIWFALILVTFFLGGSAILNFFGITLNALQIAGGVIIVNSGFGLLNSKFQERRMDDDMQTEAEEMDDVSFTPMAMPMLSGPGSISLLIGLFAAQSEWVSRGLIIGVILTMAGLIYGTLRLAPVLDRLLGRTGLAALSRIMGFLVMSIGIQMLMAGVVDLVKSLL